jgi:hypothetical protein
MAFVSEAERVIRAESARRGVGRKLGGRALKTCGPSEVMDEIGLAGTNLGEGCRAG